MYFDTPVQVISTVSLVLVCAYAVWRGGRPERWAAALVFIDWFATPLLQNQRDLGHIQIAIFVLDGAFTAAIFGIAITSNRFWPLWMAAFLLLELVMHVAMLVDHRVRGRAYFIGMEIFSYFSLLALAIGARIEGPRPALRTRGSITS